LLHRSRSLADVNGLFRSSGEKNLRNMQKFCRRTR
jgi:hypothetical protein